LVVDITIQIADKRSKIVYLSWMPTATFGWGGLISPLDLVLALIFSEWNQEDILQEIT
jgi:hypothetical protein